MFRSNGELVLPLDVLVMILSFLKLNDFLSVFLLNRRFNRIGKLDRIWDNNYKYYYPGLFTSNATKLLAENRGYTQFRVIHDAPNIVFIHEYLTLYVRHEESVVFYSESVGILKKLSSREHEGLRISIEDWCEFIYTLRKDARECKPTFHSISSIFGLTTRRPSLLNQVYHALANYIIEKISYGPDWQAYIHKLRRTNYEPGGITKRLAMLGDKSVELAQYFEGHYDPITCYTLYLSAFEKHFYMPYAAFLNQVRQKTKTHRSTFKSTETITPILEVPIHRLMNSM